MLKFRSAFAAGAGLYAAVMFQLGLMSTASVILRVWDGHRVMPAIWRMRACGHCEKIVRFHSDVMRNDWL